MKTTKNGWSKMLLAGMAAMMLVFVLVLTGCPTDAGGGGGGEKIISGTLTPKTIEGGVTATPKKFYGEVGSTPTANVKIMGVRSVSGEVTSYPVTGKLEDGDLVYNFKGQYEPEGGIFSVQAKASNIIFSLSGKLNDNGELDTTKSKASIQVLSGGDWITIVYDLDTGDSSSIANETVTAPSANAPASLPAAYLGKWRNILDPDGKEYFVVTENSILYNSEAYGLSTLDVVALTQVGGSYDITVKSQYVGDENTYTERYNVAASLQTAIQDEPASIFDETLTGTIGDYVTTLETGTRFFVVPYASTAGECLTDFSPLTVSPLFNSLSAANAATVLHAIPYFTFLCEK